MAIVYVEPAAAQPNARDVPILLRDQNLRQMHPAPHHRQGRSVCSVGEGLMAIVHVQPATAQPRVHNVPIPLRDPNPGKMA